MELTFEPTVQANVTEAIIVNGRKIGELYSRDDRGNYRYHAALNVTKGLIQGFGPTKKDAITAAVKDGHDRIASITRGVAELEELLGM